MDITLKNELIITEINTYIDKELCYYIFYNTMYLKKFDLVIYLGV